MMANEREVRAANPDAEAAFKRLAAMHAGFMTNDGAVQTECYCGWLSQRYETSAAHGCDYDTLRVITVKEHKRHQDECNLASPIQAPTTREKADPETPAQVMSDEARFIRAGKALHDLATQMGWKNDGEGAMEYVQRLSYYAGTHDAASRLPQPSAPAAQPDWESSSTYLIGIENIVGGVQNTDNARDHIRRALLHLTEGERRSLYHSVFTLIRKKAADAAR